MPSSADGWSSLRTFFENDPVLALALGAALFAFATTPLAFLVLGRMDWFRARRGRVMQKPEFWSVVCSMMLVMTIPAIFAALVLKSRRFDERRYEFDPNQTISVLDQGRQYRTLKEADEAVRAEKQRLETVRKDLVNAVKKLDEGLLPLRAAASQHPATYQALPGVLDRLADIHKAVGLDAPQQLMTLTAPPAAIVGSLPPPGTAVVYQPVPAATGAAPAASAGNGNGLSPAEIAAELATVPEPQKPIASQLPLSNIPDGWVLGKLGDKHLETFNADNLYEKIDGRAESFLQYGVQGMAYCNYHLASDETTEVQLYIFDMGDAIRAFGKYGSEKSDDVTPAEIGKAGYTSAGSVFFYAGRYYTQIVSATEDPKAESFALELAKRIAAAQTGTPAPSAPSPAAPVAATTTPSAAPAAAEVTPDQLFELLPSGPNRSSDKYAAQDVFGYSFLADVFLADYKDGDSEWQGFIRPYASPEEARQIFDKYVEQARSFGAKVAKVDCPDADDLVISNLDGLIDAVFLKGNALAGANGSTDPAKAEAFARAFAKQLPKAVPALPSTPKRAASPSGGEYSDK